MNKEKKVVSSYAEALENAIHFQEYLKTSEPLQHKLSQYTHWYFFEKKGIYAPSKFIGYKNNTYNSESAHPGDGRVTEKALARLFRKVKRSKDQPDIFVLELYANLSAMLGKHGKKLKRNAIIHIPKEKSKQ